MLNKSQMILLLITLFLSSGCSDSSSSLNSDSPKESQKVLKTCGDQTSLLEEEENISFSYGETNDSSLSIISIDEDTLGQKVDSFGGAVTHAVANQLMKDSNGATRKKILTDLFTSSGADFNTIRIPIGSSDFIAEEHFFTCCDKKGSDEDPLEYFTLEHDQEMIEVIKEILELKSDLRIIATPWSPPAWMKDDSYVSDEDPYGYAICGGTLKSSQITNYALYLQRFVEEYQKLGITIDYLSILNEPLVEGTQYPSMNLPCDTAVKITLSLIDLLPSSVQLLAYDHNCEEAMYNYLSTLFKYSKVDDAYSGGIAIHGYGSQTLYSGTKNIRSLYPDKKIYMSEITEWEHSSSFSQDLMYCVKNTTIRSLNAGLSGTIYWNLVLSSQGEPNLGQKSICYGVCNLDYNEDGLSSYSHHASYYALAHVSKLLNLSENNYATSLMVSSENENLLGMALMTQQGRIEIVIANISESPIEFLLKKGQMHFTYTLDAKSVISIYY